MAIYLTAAAALISLAGTTATVYAVLLLRKLTKRMDRCDDALADLKAADAAGVREVGERIAANQALLRKRIDNVDEAIKRHSTRIDLAESRISAEVARCSEAIGTGVAALAESIEGGPDDGDAL